MTSYFHNGGIFRFFYFFYFCQLWRAILARDFIFIKTLCVPLRSSLGAKKPAVGRVTNFSSQLYNYILIFLNILDDIDG